MVALVLAPLDVFLNVLRVIVILFTVSLKSILLRGSDEGLVVETLIHGQYLGIVVVVIHGWYLGIVVIRM